jgi:hypothetical protein
MESNDPNETQSDEVFWQELPTGARAHCVPREDVASMLQVAGPRVRGLRLAYRTGSGSYRRCAEIPLEGGTDETGESLMFLAGKDVYTVGQIAEFVATMAEETMERVRVPGQRPGTYRPPRQLQFSFKVLDEQGLTLGGVVSWQKRRERAEPTAPQVIIGDVQPAASSGTEQALVTVVLAQSQSMIALVGAVTSGMLQVVGAMRSTQEAQSDAFQAFTDAAVAAVTARSGHTPGLDDDPPGAVTQLLTHPAGANLVGAGANALNKVSENLTEILTLLRPENPK